MSAYDADPGWRFLREDVAEMLKAAASKKSNYNSTKSCWIPDAAEGYVEAEISSVEGDNTTVTVANGQKKTLKSEEVQEQNPPKFEKSEDMANLTFLNEASVLHNLRQRYYSMLIYTYSGLFCVVVNPYKRLPIYAESIIKMYQGKRRTEMPPHLFAVADEAYRNMILEHENQSLLITGESGAGKTENTKQVVAYFAIVGATSSKTGKRDAKVGSLEEQIVQTNPVIEAFGNAKTVRNNNSSRFGKFIRVHFNAAGRLAGGDIEHYLLEKSRVIRQAPGERSYHIFYQIISGRIKGVRESLLLDNDIKLYRFASQGELTIENVDDGLEHVATDEAFDIMGFTRTEKDDLYKMCASVLHLGALQFKQRPREEQAEFESGGESADKACKLLGVDAEQLVKALLSPRVRVGAGSWVNKCQNLEQVTWSVGALANALYARSFKWLVERCNQTLSSKKELTKDFFIGVLDIAGFEIFDHNSFEQIWINFVNEKLQQFFNHHMFVLEQEEYQREGIQWDFIDFGLDLQACIELIEKPLGIISILDEECIVPKATDFTFVDKLNDQHLTRNASNYQRPKPPKGKQADAHFAIVHYAGTVRYNVVGWLDKNKDPLNDTAVALLKASTSSKLLNEIWADYTTQEELADAAARGTEQAGAKKGRSSAFQTVSMLYRESLNNLMAMLQNTHPHFIRCIIPNELKKSGYIDAPLVLNQLTCNGVLEGIRICRKGFPNRLSYAEFGRRYAILAATAATDKDPKRAGELMTLRMEADNKLGHDQYRLGLTKIFFRGGILAKLEEFRDQALSKMVAKLQCIIRAHLAHLDCQARLNQKDAVLTIQRNIRIWCAVRTWSWFRLLSNVKPFIQASNATKEEIEKMENTIKEMESLQKQQAEKLSAIEHSKHLIEAELKRSMQQLQAERDKAADYEAKLSKAAAEKVQLQKENNELEDQVAHQKELTARLERSNAQLQAELSSVIKKQAETEIALKNSEAERQNLISQHKAALSQKDLAIEKLTKEKQQQEEVNAMLAEARRANEERIHQLESRNGKLEQTLEDAQNALERERRMRTDLEKSKKKAENDHKNALDTIDEASRQRNELENVLKKKDAAYKQLQAQLEYETGLVNKLQKQIRDLEARIQELEAEVEFERQARVKLERGRAEFQNEIDELNEKLDEAKEVVAQLNNALKKRDGEVDRLRKELGDCTLQHEAVAHALRKKHAQSVSELGGQCAELQRAKTKLEEEKAMIKQLADDNCAAAESEQRLRTALERQLRAAELQIADLESKLNAATREAAEVGTKNQKLVADLSTAAHQHESSQAQIQALIRTKNQLHADVEEAHRVAEEEIAQKQSLHAQLTNSRQDVDAMRLNLQEVEDARAELQRQLQKANAEALQWKLKYETEGAGLAKELDENKRRSTSKLQDMQEQLDTANGRLAQMDKSRQAVQTQLEKATADMESSQSEAQHLEKKLRLQEKATEDFKRRAEDSENRLLNTQKEARMLSSEISKMKIIYTEANEQAETIIRENLNLTNQYKDLTEQLGSWSKALDRVSRITLSHHSGSRLDLLSPSALMIAAGYSTDDLSTPLGSPRP